MERRDRDAKEAKKNKKQAKRIRRRSIPDPTTQPIWNRRPFGKFPPLTSPTSVGPSTFSDSSATAAQPTSSGIYGGQGQFSFPVSQPTDFPRPRSVETSRRQQHQRLQGLPAATFVPHTTTPSASSPPSFTSPVNAQAPEHVMVPAPLPMGHLRAPVTDGLHSMSPRPPTRHTQPSTRQHHRQAHPYPAPSPSRRLHTASENSTSEYAQAGHSFPAGAFYNPGLPASLQWTAPEHGWSVNANISYRPQVPVGQWGSRQPTTSVSQAPANAVQQAFDQETEYMGEYAQMAAASAEALPGVWHHVSTSQSTPPPFGYAHAMEYHLQASHGTMSSAVVNPTFSPESWAAGPSQYPMRSEHPWVTPYLDDDDGFNTRYDNA